MDSKSDTRKDAGSVFVGQESKHYGANFNINGKQVACLSKKQIKALYPRKNYNVAAEYAPKVEKSSSEVLKYDDLDLDLSEYKSNNRLVFSEKGFVRVGEDDFVVLLKKALIQRIFAAALCLVLIAAGVFAVTSLLNKTNIEAIDNEMIAAAGVEEQAQPELEEGAVDWEGAKPRETGGVTQGISIPGYKSITVAAGEREVNVNLQNPEGNPCYFVISLILDDGTVIYKSKMIEPGKGLYVISLTEPLEEGEFSAVVKYETFSLEGLNPLNGAEVKITLIAE